MACPHNSDPTPAEMAASFCGLIDEIGKQSHARRGAAHAWLKKERHDLVEKIREEYRTLYKSVQDPSLPRPQWLLDPNKPGLVIDTASHHKKYAEFSTAIVQSLKTLLFSCGFDSEVHLKISVARIRYRITIFLPKLSRSLVVVTDEYSSPPCHINSPRVARPSDLTVIPSNTSEDDGMTSDTYVFDKAPAASRFPRDLPSFITFANVVEPSIPLNDFLDYADIPRQDEDCVSVIADGSMFTEELHFESVDSYSEDEQELAVDDNEDSEKPECTIWIPILMQVNRGARILRYIYSFRPGMALVVIFPAVLVLLFVKDFYLSATIRLCMKRSQVCLP
ncbi:hypothetical protein Hypma_014952 [Hypsizygus marmoreus]|uniref:Uncharacterized protein n=1 Tax=Hypsizygus marmoreus TaxID=39966 RepID=A0A369K4C5_HYPMA|nr:hypothetical protein Hypma_014952 [Hypsizygus marmoreus]